MRFGLVLVWTGCQGSPSLRPASRPTFSTDGLSSAPWCDATPTQPAAPLGSFRLAPVRPANMPEGIATTAANAAALVWERLGAQVEVLPEAELSTSPVIQSEHADAPDEAFRGVRDVLATLAQGPIYVAVLPQLFSEPAQIDASFRGLTFSRQLPDAWSRDLREGAPYSPLVLLNDSAGPRAPGDLSLTPAHEVGHALGLVHRATPEGLMAEGPLAMRCLPGLSAREVATVQQNLALPSLASAPPSRP